MTSKYYDSRRICGKLCYVVTTVRECCVCNKNILKSFTDPSPFRSLGPSACLFSPTGTVWWLQVEIEKRVMCYYLIASYAKGKTFLRSEIEQSLFIFLLSRTKHSKIVTYFEQKTLF